MKKLFFYLIIVFLVGCEKKSDHLIKSEDLNLLVVDGMITNEHAPQTIRLTRTVSELNAVPQTVSGAHIMLSDSIFNFNFDEETSNPGVYQTHWPFFAKKNVEYTLLITVDGKTYTAKTYMVQNGPFNSLKYQKNTSDDLYHIIWIENPYDAVHPAMFRISLDWSKVPGYTTLDPSTCKATLYYYTLPTLDVGEIFAPEIQQINFPLGTRIYEKKYSMNPEYTEFIRAMISETTWKGGLFDSAPANVPTNMSEGAIGFFTACEVFSDSLVVQ